MDPRLQYAVSRIIELERLLLVDAWETVWPDKNLNIPVEINFVLKLKESMRVHIEWVNQICVCRV